jgi:menaquinol-cytochrome c reductase iron-sulfur subunit
MTTPDGSGEQLQGGNIQTRTEVPEFKAVDRGRRAFLFKLAVLLNGIVGAVLAIPVIGYILGPALRRDSSFNSWVSLGPMSDFPEGETRLVDYRNPVSTDSDGETDKVACWVRRLQGAKFQVFAINCAHLGCPVRWFAQSKLFMCPCHGGAYYADGSRASGPPARGLFEYHYSIVDNNLMINAGEMPTLSNEACLKKPLIQIQTQASTAPTLEVTGKPGLSS